MLGKLSFRRNPELDRLLQVGTPNEKGWGWDYYCTACGDRICSQAGKHFLSLVWTQLVTEATHVLDVGV